MFKVPNIFFRAPVLNFGSNLNFKGLVLKFGSQTLILEVRSLNLGPQTLVLKDSVLQFSVPNLNFGSGP